MEQKQWRRELEPVQVWEKCQLVWKTLLSSKDTLSFLLDVRESFLFKFMAAFQVMKFLVTVAVVFAIVCMYSQLGSDRVHHNFSNNYNNPERIKPVYPLYHRWRWKRKTEARVCLLFNLSKEGRFLPGGSAAKSSDDGKGAANAKQMLLCPAWQSRMDVEHDNKTRKSSNLWCSG